MPPSLANVNDLVPRLIAMRNPELTVFLREVLRDGLGATPATFFSLEQGEQSRSLLDVVLEGRLGTGLGDLYGVWPANLHKQAWCDALTTTVIHHDHDPAHYADVPDRVEDVFDRVYPRALAAGIPDPLFGLINLAQQAGWRDPQTLREDLSQQMGHALWSAARDLARAKQGHHPDKKKAKADYAKAVAFAQKVDPTFDQFLGPVPPEHRFQNGLPEAVCVANDLALGQPLIAVLPSIAEGEYFLERFVRLAMRHGATAILPELLTTAQTMAPAATRHTHPFGVELTKQIKDAIRTDRPPAGNHHPDALAYLNTHFAGKKIQPLAPTAVTPRRNRP